MIIAVVFGCILSCQMVSHTLELSNTNHQDMGRYLIDSGGHRECLQIFQGMYLFGV